MSFRLEYEVAEAGWATCRVVLNGKHVDMTASYVHDSLHQLCDVVASIANGAKCGTIIFMTEPGEHHLVLERYGETEVVVRIVWHEDWTSWGFMSKSESRVVLEGVTYIAHVRGQTYAAARRILESLGPEEYRRRWVQHDFPEASYKKLQTAG